jgi:hypothetical protein
MDTAVLNCIFAQAGPAVLRRWTYSRLTLRFSGYRPVTERR